jgi:hypothetical protein
MRITILLVVCFWASAVSSETGAKSHLAEPSPEQIHLAATEMPSSVIVMWVTFAPSTQSMVKYGLTESALTTDVSGKMVKFDDGEKVRYMHAHCGTFRIETRDQICIFLWLWSSMEQGIHFQYTERRL